MVLNTSIDIVTVVFLLGAAQGVFLAVLLLNKPGNRTANRLLALLMFSYSAFIAESSIAGTSIARQFPHLLGLAAGVIFLVGPLHYLYARALMEPGFRISSKHLLHLIPFVFFYLYFLFPFYLRSGDYKIAYIDQLAREGQPLSLVLFNWLVIFQGLGYLAATLVLLRRHRRRIRENFSSIERINLGWLRYITLMTMAVWVLGLIVKLLHLPGLMPPSEVSVPVAIALLVYAMGYLGLRQPEIFSGLSGEREQKKYERSGLTPDKAGSILERLIRVMDSEKPYTDSNLKLTRLAGMLAVTPNHLSQVINENRQENFFDFVNRYRVEEAKRMMTDAAYGNLTLLSIAYDVGFNSKSAFYTAFKKHAGMTPAQYKKTAS